MVFNNSQLVTSQLSGDYQARDERMAAYLSCAKQLLLQFQRAEVKQISRLSNSHADALANLASAVEAGKKRMVEVGTLETPSIELPPVRYVLCADLGPSWMDPVVAYLRDDQLPKDKNEAHKIRLKAARFCLSLENKLYRKSFTDP